jgi:hypothetical protein
MPMRIIAGQTRKLGLPSYGSEGASCAFEIELELSALQGDLAAIQTRIRALYELCRRATAQQLTIHESSQEPNGSSAGTGANGDDAGAQPRLLPPAGQNGFSGHRAAVYVRASSGSSDPYAGRPTPAGAGSSCMRGRLVELSSVEASQLIDLLRDLRAGKQAVMEVLTGTAA